MIANTQHVVYRHDVDFSGQTNTPKYCDEEYTFNVIYNNLPRIHDEENMSYIENMRYININYYTY